MEKIRTGDRKRTASVITKAFGSAFLLLRKHDAGHLKDRLKVFVPVPRPMEITALDRLPANHDLPYERWNPKQRTSEKGTEPVPLTVHEAERAAQRELLAVLRLVDAGKVAVSDKTRRASASTIETITALLDGGDYYPHVAG